MFVVKVYCMIETSLDHAVNFHHEHCIVPTNCPWVSENGFTDTIMTMKAFRDYSLTEFS